MKASDLLFDVWLAGMVGTVTYLFFVQILWRYLRQNCPAVWDSLGRPSFWNNSPKVGLVFVRWLLRRDYRQIEDRTGVRIAQVTEGLFWIAGVLIVLIFGLAIATHGGEAWPL
jgi:hypothetical protein